MQDTPDHIKQLQLQIRLSKSISERLEQTIIDNDALFKLWKQAKEQISLNNNASAASFDLNLQKKFDVEICRSFLWFQEWKQ